MKNMDALCPLCCRPARSARCDNLNFIDCCHCSHYRIDDEAMHGLYADPLPPDQVAAIAFYNWEWPTCELNAVNVRSMGRFLWQDEHHRFCQCLLRVLHNTYAQRRFLLRLDNPMLLGITASPSPAALRELVTKFGAGRFLPVLKDNGSSIVSFVSDDAVSLMSLPVRVAPGIVHAIDLDGLRGRAA